MIAIFALSKDHTANKVLSKYSVIILLIFFCPIWIVVLKIREDGDILYRVLWLLPIGIVIAYTAVTLLYKLEKKKRTIGIIGVVLVLLISGEYIYANPYFTKAENSYHVPQAVVDICDEIVVPGREIKAAFPDELISYVRQYTSLICLPYGRDVLISNYVYNSALQDALNEDIIDTVVTSQMLRDELTAYVILEKDHKTTENFETYGFHFVKSIDGYDLYLDDNAYLGLEFK